jgi:hypothetical protein
MATSPKAGSFTALQRLKPITTDFGDIVENAVEDDLARKAAAKAEEDANKKAKSELANKFGETYESLEEVITKTKSINEANARGINSARDLTGDIFKAAETDPTVMNTMEWQMKKANLNNFSKNLKLVSDRYTEYATTLSAGMQDGTLSGWNKEQLNDLDSIFRKANLDIRADRETGLPIGVIAEVDDDGEATGKLKELNLVEVLDGRGLNQSVNTFKFKDSITEIGSDLGQRLVKEVGSNLTHIEYQKFSKIEPDVRKMVRGFIGNEGNPKDVAKSIWVDQMSGDIKDLTAADMKRIEDFYVNGIKGFYDEKNMTTKDFRTGYNYSRAKKTDDDEMGLGIQLRTNEAGEPDTEPLTGVAGDIRGESFQFTLPGPIRLGIKGENREISNLFLTPDGKIAYKETVYKGKVSGDKINPVNVYEGTVSGEYVTTERVGGGLNTTELNDIARELKFPNTKALKDALMEAYKKQTGKTFGGTSNNENIDTSKYN